MHASTEGQFTRRQRVRQYLWRHSAGLTVALATLALSLVPLLFWTGVRGSSMNLGGDNGLLYFEYPLQWLAHTSTTAVSQNLSGYNPIPQYTPLALLLLALHVIGVNAQGAFLGLVLAAFFLGTVTVAGQVLQLAFPDRDRAEFSVPSLLAGVVVVSAPVLAQTQWSAILPGLWWEALLPWLLVFYLRHQATGRLRFPIMAGLLCSLLASAITDVPITIGAALAALLLVGSLHVSGVSRLRTGHCLAFAAILVATSAFWAIPFAAALVLPQLQVQGALSTSGKEAAAAIVRGLAPLQSPVAAIEMRLGTAFMAAFRWPQLGPGRWASALGPIGALPYFLTTLTIFSGIVVARRRRPLALLVLLALSTCVPLVLLAPDLAFGERAMLDLISVVPGWTATRNFYNVFGLPLVFLLALTASLALSQLSLSPMRMVASRTVVFGMAIVLLVYNAPFLAGSYFRLPYQLGGSYNRVVPGLPADYVDLLDRLRDLPPGPVLSLPLSAPAWTAIPARAVTHHLQGVYIGISPVYFLTGRSDYNGVASFENAVAPSLPGDIQSGLTAEDTEAFVDLMRALGVRYVILNTAPLARQDYYGVAAVADPLVEAMETSAIVRALAPTIVAKRGVFELRSVSNAVPYPVRLITTSGVAAGQSFVSEAALGLPRARVEKCPTWSAAVDQTSPWRVTVSLRPRLGASHTRCTLVLEDPQSALWTATAESAGSAVSLPAPQVALGLFAGFRLPGGHARPVTVVIQYQGELLLAGGLGVSVFAWLGILGWGYRRVRHQRRSSSEDGVLARSEEET